MKKVLKVLTLIIGFTFILMGCSTSKNHIKEITFEDFKEKINNKDSFVLYVGNEECSHCISYKPVLEKVLEDYDINIYHLNNRALSDKELSEFKSYVSISGTPTVLFIENGEEETTLNRITGETSRKETIEKFKINGYIK